MADTKHIDCDILVLGGGMGGIAAALRAADRGYKVCLTEENPWIGGQCTSQGVSALDEHAYIEHFGGTASYYQFRHQIRDFYHQRYNPAPEVADDPYRNPGAGWVSRLCFEPRAALGTLLEMLMPHIEANQLAIYYRTQIIAAQRQDRILRSVTVSDPDYGRPLCFHPSYVLDATETGDLLPLLNLPYVSGAESQAQTGEPHARTDGSAAAMVQTFTFPFVVDFQPGGDFTIPKPPNYEFNRDHQPYTLTLRYGARDLTYKVFAGAPDLPGSFWTYRRLLAAEQFAPGEAADLSMINWPGNDYKGGSLFDVPAEVQAQRMMEAKNLSLGLLYWLQTEVPRDDGTGHGYPELRLRYDVLGTNDGLSQFPYIRESRRIIARKTVVEHEVSAACQPHARAAFFADSVGLGLYPIDIHGLPGDAAGGGLTKPFQIPLGALIPQDLDNVVPACKNLGVTHITNGCYRLHPVEWNIGESAGALAAFCLATKQQPGKVYEHSEIRRDFQLTLLEDGIPLYWYEDVPLDHPAFKAVQILAQEKIALGHDEHLRFEPDGALDQATADGWARRLEVDGLAVEGRGKTRGEYARLLAAHRFGIEA